MKFLITSLVCVAALVAAGFWFLKPSEEPAAEKGKVSQPEEAAIEKPRDDVMLSPEKQQLIWDAEHITFQLEKKFGQAFRTALAKRDVSAVRSFFKDDATGQIPTEGGWHETVQAPLQRSKRTAEDGLVAASADEVVAQLLEELDAITEVERHKLRVLKINKLSEQSWECRLLLVLVGAGEDVKHVISESEHIVQFEIEDKDNLESAASIIAWNFDKQSRRSSTQTFMQEVTKEVGLGNLAIPDNWRASKRLPNWFQLGVADYDKDGDPDIAITTNKGKRFVLENKDGAYVHATKKLRIPAAFPTQPSHFLSVWFDYNNDGYPDLLSGQQLFRNEEGKTFTDVTRQAGLKPQANSSGGVVADYDCDGHLDIYFVNQSPAVRDRSKKASWVSDNDSGAENHLWRNKGDGSFEFVSPVANAGGGMRASHSAIWFYYDDDKYPDLYVANDFGKNVLLRNKGDGTFEDVSVPSQTDGYSTSMGIAAGDIDNNGQADLYVSNMYSKMGRRIIGMVSADDYPDDIYEQICGSCAGNRLYLRENDDPTRFYDVGEKLHVNGVGWAWGPTMADFDSDGWLDLYSTTGYMSATRGKPDG
ncbi:MAG: FG-GAP repeat domain-containing protein [Planctomycetaceae bacterium]